jgi:hypothetical protein
MSEDLPKLITYNTVSPFEGKLIGINEKEVLDIFPVKRIYWINYSSLLITQSEHAHKTLKQIIIAVDGEISISLKSRNGETYNYTLNDPSKGLYIPPFFWKKIEYTKPCVLLCLASESFNENDYIRSYEEFIK